MFGIPGYLTYRVVRQERLNAALIRAIKSGKTSLALAALQNGADANSRDVNKDFRPQWKIMWDMMHGRRAPRSSRPTALSLFLCGTIVEGDILLVPQDSPLVKALLDRGANPNGQSSDEYTPLWLAVHWNNEKSIEWLLQYGSNPNEQTSEGTPLIEAVESRNEKVIKLLLDHGANINGKSVFSEDEHLEAIKGNGSTPLAMSVLCRNPEIVRLLLARHADANLANCSNKTPLALAETAQYLEPVPSIIKMLKHAGAHR